MTENKVILITGTSTGFGKLIAMTLAKDGHTVYASMRGIAAKNEAAAKELTDWSQSQGNKLKVIKLDVTDESSAGKAVKSIVSDQGKIDIVVNNAGVAGAGLTEAYTIEQAKKMFEVNTFGPMRVIRAALPQMRKQKSGLLIQISSVVGRLTMPYFAPYIASKFAVEALAQIYSMELAPLGIESVIIEPGAYPTELFGKLIQADDQKVIDEYGELAKGPENLFAGLSEMFKGDNAPNPQVIADTVKKLVDTPVGSRPLRTVADAFNGKIVEDLNQAADKAQAEMMKAMGMN
jgi:NAD(P)-dependent dehydrogenase (short-subunit alcohol dehydrogenase family)